MNGKPSEETRKMDRDHPPLEIHCADPRTEQAAGLLRGLSWELSLRYDFADDGSGNFKPEDGLLERSAFVIGAAAGRGVACGAFRPMDGDAAEIKRMYVVPEHRGRGYSKAILAELERLALEMGYRLARLETGIRQPEAIALYERAGYRRISNYGIYRDNPLSLCFEKLLRR